MKISQAILFYALLISTVFIQSCEAKIAHAKTESFKIYGNCEKCKKRIEAAGTLKNQFKTDWNVDSKIATITYDAQTTNANVVLKKIALAGHDNEKFLSPLEVYQHLPECCRYNRPITIDSAKATVPADTHTSTATASVDTLKNKPATNEVNIIQHPFDEIYSKYFTLKNDLIKDNSSGAMNSAQNLLVAINSILSGQLSESAKGVFSKNQSTMVATSNSIKSNNNIGKQRASFSLLSESIYALMKVEKLKIPIYYDHCPMYNNGKGANWLSTESTIKNPYYGAEMIGCGSVQETIK